MRPGVFPQTPLRGFLVGAFTALYPSCTPPERKLPVSIRFGFKPESLWDPEFVLELRVEFKLGPQPINQGQRVAVDPRDQRLTGFNQLRHAAVAEAPRHLLTHPVPQPLDRVEIRAVAGPGDKLDAQPRCCRLHPPGAVARRVVPDQHQTPLLARPPTHQLTQEQYRLLPVAPAVLP